MIDGQTPNHVQRYGTTPDAVFTVSLGGPSGSLLTVDFTTVDGTASDGSDYVASSGTLTFAPGTTTQSIVVPLVNDSVEEPTEDFVVNLSSADGAYIQKPQGTATILDDDAVPPVLLYFSLTSSATLPGIAGTVQDEDVVAYNGSDFDLVFDGSDVGLSGVDVDALSILDDGSLLLSFTAAASIGPLGTVDDSDIVRFIPTGLGDVTAGTFELYFDGSDVGLTRSGEDIDGLEFLPNGTLLISTTGSVSVPNASGSDEDLLAFTPSSLGSSTSGSWVRYFDGSDVGLSNSSSEDTNAAAVGPDDKIYFSTLGDFSVTAQAVPMRMFSHLRLARWAARHQDRLRCSLTAVRF